MRPILPLSTITAALMLAACQQATEERPAAASAAVETEAVAMNAAPTEEGVPQLVSGVCAGCHAIKPNQISPLAEAPSFVDLANTPGLTHDTLVAYLSDAHNYPDVMDVDLDQVDVETVTMYLLTLQSEDYRRVPS